MATLAGAFPDSTKVLILGLTNFSANNDVLMPVFVAGHNGVNSLYVQTYRLTEQDGGGNLLKTAQDAWLFNIPIQILVFD